MKTRAQIDLENLALSAELSRQLAHDFSNFLYNLLLQIEIWENSPKARQLDWEQMKRDGKKMAGLLKQWEHFQRRFSAEEPSNVDLHELIREVVGSVATAAPPIGLAPSISAEPFWFKGCPTEVQHLVRLALEVTFLACQQAERPDPPRVCIYTEKTNDKAVVRIHLGDHARGDRSRIEDCEANPEDAPAASLVEAACRSLALRIDATIRRESCGEGEYAMVVEFPLTQTCEGR